MRPCFDFVSMQIDSTIFFVILAVDQNRRFTFVLVSSQFDRLGGASGQGVASSSQKFRVRIPRILTKFF